VTASLYVPGMAIGGVHFSVIDTVRSDEIGPKQGQISVFQFFYRFEMHAGILVT